MGWGILERLGGEEEMMVWRWWVFQRDWIIEALFGKLSEILLVSLVIW